MRNKYSLFFLVAFTFLMNAKVNADTVYVNVMDTFFDPADFTVQTGDFVKWTLMQGSHTTTSNTIPSGAASWNYTFTGSGDSFIYEVMETGNYIYECLFHGGMMGSFTAVASLPDTVYVNVMDTFFDPSDFTVQPGDFVKWTLMQGSHTTTSNTIPSGAASWDYTFTGVGDSFVYEVTETGSYNYECLIHPGMNGSFSTVASLPDTVYVDVMNNFFDPADFTVQVGDVIKWTLMESMHTTTSNSIPSGAASWDYTFSGIGDSFIYEVTEVGFYNYECLFHPGMNGSFTALDNTTFLFTVTLNDGWNMVSIPGLHPVNQNVNTWFSGRDPGANVFKFNNGYQAVTELEPGVGYWLKHLGTQVYKIILLYVPHNPINANAGWNLFGGYEYNAQVSGITTNPPGLVEGSVFGYSGGYSPASELIPGFGYWIKLSAAGQIILPHPVFMSMK